MMPGPVSQRIVLDRLEWVRRMTDEIATLPLDDEEAFLADDRHSYVAEPCLRRALEALLDIGRQPVAALARRWGGRFAAELGRPAGAGGQIANSEPGRYHRGDWISVRHTG